MTSAEWGAPFASERPLRETFASAVKFSGEVDDDVILYLSSFLRRL
jgi:hypothetical protein